MHPIFKSKRATAVYALIWLLVGAQTSLLLNRLAGFSKGEIAIAVPLTMLVLAAFCLVPLYLCRALPLRTTSPAKPAGIILLSALIVSAIAVAILRVGLHLAAPAPESRFQPIAPLMISSFTLLYLLSVALHYMLIAVESSKQSEVLSREAELKALKAQINPHFLFNSLNSISALALDEPRRAREMCIKLADFLRTSLRLGERLTIPLAEELALARTYLGVEQIRFGARLGVEQDADSRCLSCEVPPLLVQPLVENAIKHGIATLTEGGTIAIQGKRRGADVEITVINPFDPDGPNLGRSGVGLLNVRSRLQARYGGGAHLNISIRDGVYRVTLLFPFQESQP